MARITIPAIVRPLHLRDYAEEYGDATIWVWVNPPREKRQALTALLGQFQEKRQALVKLAAQGELKPDEVQAWSDEVEALGRVLYGWLSEIWSQHEDAATHWPVEEIEELASEAIETDPGLWEFVQERSLGVMAEYRDWRKKKANETPSD